jgi:hypothetical protein
MSLRGPFLAPAPPDLAQFGAIGLRPGGRLGVDLRTTSPAEGDIPSRKGLPAGAHSRIAKNRQDRTCLTFVHIFRTKYRGFFNVNNFVQKL